MDTITRYRFDPAHSRFTVQVFATGFLSFMGHDPVFSIRDFEGAVWFEDDMVAKLNMELIVRAKSLALRDALKPADHDEIETRMRGDVLDIDAFPDIAFRASAAVADRVANGHYRLGLDGNLTVRGVSHPHRSVVDLMLLADGVRLKGDTRVRMSAYRIPPVSALGGAIRLKDEAVLSFDLSAKSESS